MSPLPCKVEIKISHVACQNNHIEILSKNLKTVLKNIDSVLNDRQITYQNNRFLTISAVLGT